MADSEKGNSSTKESKANTSLLDEDFSKDFLSSWKSMSAVGDDMDFNFEPVSKGKKKAFDFGMDMDFSLDDAFGKISSFKIDMPDLDFSSSPKKTSKSKEKPEEVSSKGNRIDKHDNFAFSFDFNGLDDFSLDAPSTRGGKSPSTETNNKNDGSECEYIPKQVTNDKKETAEDLTNKGPVVCEDAAFSKSEDSVVVDIPSVNYASKSTVSYTVQQKETQISSDKNLAEHPHKTDRESFKEGEATSKKSCSPVREGIIDPISADRPPSSIDSLMPVKSADVRMSSGTEKTMNSLSIDDEIQQKEEEITIQSHTQLQEMNHSTNTPLVEASVQINVSEELEVSSPGRKENDGSAQENIVAQELPEAVDLTSVAEKLILDKSPQQCSTDKMSIHDGKNELGSSGSLGLLDAVDPSATCDKSALSSSARCDTKMQNPVLKVSPAPIGSGPTAAKTCLTRNEVPGVMNSKFPVTQATNDGSRTKLSAYKDNKEGSAHIGAVDRSKHNKKKSNDNPSSCTKELMKPESVSEKSEKIAAGHTPTRDQEDTIDGKTKNEANINKVLPNGKEAKNGLPSLLCEKMMNNVKSSGFKIPSLSPPPEQGTKFGDQGQGKLKDNISSISSIQKLNIGQENKLSSQRIEKKMLALPSLKLTRRITSDKQLATPTKQRNSASPGNFEKRTRLQAATKMVSPMTAEKQTPSTLSLKRKPSEAADAGPAKLHTPKRLSPNESRMSKGSAKEHEDVVQTQGNFLEGSRKNASVEYTTPKFDFDQEANVEALQFSMMVENDENVEKAEACAKELDNICNLLKKKHEEAKELLVRALVNNNNLLMLNHPVYEEKIRAVQRLASRLMTKELDVKA